jgi:hypothetical protein
MGWLPQATDTNRRGHDKITACIPAGSVHADRSPRTNGQESVARASSVQRPLPATRAPTTSPAPSSSGKRDACLALLTHQPSVEQASSAARPTRERPATAPSRVAERLVRSTRPARVPHGLPLLPLSLMHRRDTHDARDRAELPVSSACALQSILASCRHFLHDNSVSQASPTAARACEVSPRVIRSHLSDRWRPPITHPVGSQRRAVIDSARKLIPERLLHHFGNRPGQTQLARPDARSTLAGTLSQSIGSSETNQPEGPDRPKARALGAVSRRQRSRLTPVPGTTVRGD